MGLESTELRIGNIVQYGPNVKKVISLDNCVRVIGCDTWIFPDNNDLKGIKLTSEILLKSGAIKKPSGYFIGKLKFDTNTIGLIRFHYSGKVQWLRYVHELQNLVFALTNQELEIKF